jgi:hypothetical protein
MKACETKLSQSGCFEDVGGMSSAGSGTSVHGRGRSGGAGRRNGRQGEWDGIGVIHVETIKVVIEVRKITVSMKDKFGGLRGDGKEKAFFESLVVANAKYIAIHIFPGEGETVNKGLDPIDLGGANASVDEEVDSGNSDGL